MGEIKDFIELYIADSGMIHDMLSDLSMDLENNIKDELYPEHGYDHGDLHDSINAYVVSSDAHGGKIEAGSPIGYVEYVNDGTPAVEGKLMKMPWGYRMSRKAFSGYHFMEAGLEKTVAMYR